jgi:hypothetical protein
MIDCSPISRQDANKEPSRRREYESIDQQEDYEHKQYAYHAFPGSKK